MSRLTRRLPVLAALLATALAAVPGMASANMGDKDVARMVSFGGACAKCELSGRKLAGAQFVGANFAQAALVGSDLRDARFLGANFSGADLSRADLTDAQMVGANFTTAVLTDARLRDEMNFSIFVDTPLDICLMRRIKRDVNERGRSMDSVMAQYQKTVRPMFLQFIEPSKQYADIIVPRGGKNRIAIDILKAKISQFFE